MKKSISWYALWKRIGKQPMYKTQNTKVQVLVDGELKECALVFTNNGSDFHLEPVGKVATPLINSFMREIGGKNGKYWRCVKREN